MPDPEQPLKWLAAGMLYVGLAILMMPFVMGYETMRSTARNWGRSAR